MDVIQVGVNVAGSRKKNHLCQCPWQGHGPRPVPIRCTKCMRVRVAKHKIKIPFLLLTTNSITLQNKKICHACAGFRSYCRQSTDFSLNFLFVSLAFDSAPFPLAHNASFSRKFSFWPMQSFEMCRLTSSPRTPSRQRPHLPISFYNDWPCKSILELCSRIVSNPVMKATSAEMPFPTPPKFRFKRPIFFKKPQFTFPHDV